jgi:hypothetical protein
MLTIGHNKKHHLSEINPNDERWLKFLGDGSQAIEGLEVVIEPSGEGNVALNGVNLSEPVTSFEETLDIVK